jgi:hypothetical protein
MLPIAISIAPSLWHQVTVARMSLAIFSPLLADGTKPSPSSDRGAERAAVFYSLIGSAKLIGTILKRICATYVPASPITPSTASRSCCHGTSLQAWKQQAQLAA